MSKKIPSAKETVQKMRSFFFRELQLIKVLLLICISYMSWSARFVSSKNVCGIFHFKFRLFFFLKFIFYIFVQRNAWILWLWNVIIRLEIKIIEKPHSVFLPDLRFLSCNGNFRKFRKLKFWERKFFLVTFK